MSPSPRCFELESSVDLAGWLPSEFVAGRTLGVSKESLWH